MRQISTTVEVSQPLVETAGRFADVFALRGYDSVQLAAAHELHVNAEQSVLFACFDRRLNQAAQLLQCIKEAFSSIDTYTIEIKRCRSCATQSA